MKNRERNNHTEGKTIKKENELIFRYLIRWWGVGVGGVRDHWNENKTKC